MHKTLKQFKRVLAKTGVTELMEFYWHFDKYLSLTNEHLDAHKEAIVDLGGYGEDPSQIINGYQQSCFLLTMEEMKKRGLDFEIVSTDATESK
jgi:hypothetical protein